MHADPKTIKEHQVREIAYAIWEREGRPHGQEMEHWLRAEMTLRQQVAEMGPEPGPASLAVAKKPAKKAASTAKPASGKKTTSKKSPARKAPAVKKAKA